MKFTIDDMIEFCESECEYHLKKAEMYHERFGGKDCRTNVKTDICLVCIMAST